MTNDTGNDEFDMDSLLKELSEISNGKEGFVQNITSELERFSSLEESYDECFEAYRAEKRKLYEEYAKDDDTKQASDGAKQLEVPFSTIDPDTDPEVRLPAFKDLPPEFHTYTYESLEMPITDEQKKFREYSAKLFLQIADWEKGKLEKRYGDQAKKSLYHPDNRKKAPYWKIPFV